MHPLMPGSQNYLILDYLMQGNTLTPLSAFKLFDCLRVGGRIHELRKRGWAIKTTPQMLPNGKVVAEYSL